MRLARSQPFAIECAGGRAALRLNRSTATLPTRTPSLCDLFS